MYPILEGEISLIADSLLFLPILGSSSLSPFSLVITFLVLV